MAVSVVVPTCGRPQLLQRCLEALLRQELAPGAFEVLVVDDGDDADSERIVTTLAQAHPDHALRFLRPSPGRGPAVARNFGWRAARAEVIAFTDDDTVPAPDWLSQGLRALRQGRRAALAGRVAVPRPPGAQGAPTDHEWMTRGLSNAAFVTANAFVLKPALERVQGFDERFRRPWREDSDLQFRLERHYGPIRRCERAVVAHPVRPERWGVSLHQQKNVFYDALLYRKHPRLYRQRVRRVPPWDYYAVVLAALAALAGLLLGQRRLAAGAAALALVLVLHLAWRRLRRSARTPGHVAEMLVTSALIPFLSVYWRLRGALHFRTWFF